MSTQTVTTLICDRCGTRETPIICRMSEMKLSWNGHRGGRTMQGDYGGYSINGHADLCEPCTDAFLGWIKEPST